MFRAWKLRPPCVGLTRRGSGVVGPTPDAPVIDWTSGTSAYDPTFTITTLLQGDTVELQIDDNADFSSLYDSDTNLVDSTEATTGELTFAGIATLGFATTYYARCRVTRSLATSAWSNVVSKAMDVADTTPTAFTFTDVANATPSTQYTSNQITVAGLSTGASTAVSITGGTYSKNGGAYTSAAGTAVNGDTFTVRHTSSANYVTATDTILTIGGVSDTYTTTTTVAPIATSFTYTAAPTWVDRAFSTANFQFLNVDIGTEHASRVVVVGVRDNTTNTLGFAGITVNGIAATRRADPGGTANPSVQPEIWTAPVPTGTSVTIELDPNGNSDDVAIVVGALYGCNEVPTDTAGLALAFHSQPHSITIATAPDRISVMVGYVESPTAAATLNNGTVHVENTVSTTHKLAMFSRTAAQGTGLWSVSGWGNKNSGLAANTWGA